MIMFLLATCMVMSMPSPMLESAYIILFSGRSKPSLCRQERSRDPMLILWIIRIIAMIILMVIIVTLITVTVATNLRMYLSFSPLLRWPFAPCEKKQSSRISNAVQFHHLFPVFLKFLFLAVQDSSIGDLVTP